MGGAASIEGHDLDYEALKASGVNFATAYQAIQKKALKGKSTTHLNDVSIHFLAIRQLSQNLKNQEKLEKHRNKILKSRSLPDALKHRKQTTTNDDSMLDTLDDLNAHDLAIIVDHEFNNNTLVTSSKKVRSVDTSAAATTAVAKPAKVVKKPNLFLSCGSDNSLEPVEETKTVEEKVPIKNKGAEVLNKQISPSQYARLSPQGTLHMGKWKIKENGIFLSESIRGGDTFGYDSISHGGFGASRSSMPTAMGSKNDFLLVATLGSGASGVVSEAIHLPTLTLVALKMLPVYNQQKRQHVSRELAVLYKNLADLKLIDDRLNNEDSIALSNKKKKRDTCVNVLSLYNAFVDPKSGMINLVIEYMDGGSLEDLVVQGGCRDEQVLSDIAYQTCKGLCFLHQHKSVHRDIKPANILCSSNGDIKIADFGISKALDKTTGFAQSFVGTVCYMSPERIVGETYSFPCDIWSLGLTLLAVAKGRFPLSGTESSETTESMGGSPDSRNGIGGAGSNNKHVNAPIGGAGGYWAMIKAICDERPPVAGDEFSSKFNQFIDFCLRKAPDERYSAKNLLETEFVRETAAAAEAGALLHSPIRTSSSSSAAGSAVAASNAAAAALSPPILSPMAARNATAAVVRRASKEFDRMDSKSTEDIDSEFPYHIRQSILEDHETVFDANDGVAEELAASDGTLINAVRLEHLDRVLDKIVRKLTTKTESEGGSDPFANAGDDDDDDDDMRDDDLEIHHNVGGTTSGTGSANNSSIESIDKLLFKELETPEAKKAFRELHDDRKHDHHSHHHHNGSSHHNHHGHQESVNGSNTTGHVAFNASHTGPAPLLGAVAEAKDEKVNSILKSSSSFKPHHDTVDHHAHFTVNTNGIHLAEDSRGRVHFSAEGSGEAGAVPKAAAGKPASNFRNRLKAPLALQIVDNDAEEESPTPMLPVLPKSSSYFEVSKANNHNSNSRNVAEDDAPETPAAASTPAVSGGGGAVPNMEPADYVRMLPKLNAEGLPKWEYLAYQLRLPFHLLKSAVKAKLGDIVDLEEC